MTPQPPDSGVAAMVVLTAFAVGLVLLAETLVRFLK
jgi:hypothetical protein